MSDVRKNNDENCLTYEGGKRKDEFYLVVGKNKENTVKVIFDENGVFNIGRHHQDFLKSRYISRTHCYIQKVDDGRYLLFAAKDSKKDLTYNGTFLEKNGTRLETLEYGVGYLLEDGQKFYITLDVPAIFTKHIRKEKTK